jgi:hypothetical protein
MVITIDEINRKPTGNNAIPMFVPNPLLGEMIKKTRWRIKMGASPIDAKQKEKTTIILLFFR